MGQASKERSRKLFLILGGILKHRPLKILRQVQHQNGLEAWRQLSALYVPRTKGRSLALLSAVMQFPVMTKEKTLLEQILLLERLSDEYTKSAGHQVAPDILLSTLVRILPKDVQRHVPADNDRGCNIQHKCVNKFLLMKGFLQHGLRTE